MQELPKNQETYPGGLHPKFKEGFTAGFGFGVAAATIVGVILRLVF